MKPACRSIQKYYLHCHREVLSHPQNGYAILWQASVVRIFLERMADSTRLCQPLDRFNVGVDTEF
jgi:hypothetical protein